MFEIGPWDSASPAELIEALGPADELAAQGRAMHGPDRPAPTFRRTFVARDEGRLVGVATVHESKLHPQRLWLAAEVAPEHRRHRIGTALVAAVRDAVPDARPLKAEVFANSAGAMFAQAVGWRVVQVSRTYRLTAGSIGNAPTGIEVTTDADPDEIGEAFLAFYTSAHPWDPVGDIAAAEMRALSVDTAAATFLVRAESRSVAVGCLYDETDAWLLSGGPVQSCPPAALDALIETAVDFATRSHRAVDIEVDDCMTDLAAVVRRRGAKLIDEVHIVSEH